MYLCKINPKIQANKIELKKEGKLIPKVLITCEAISKKLPFFRADITPSIKPKTIAIIIELNAKTKIVF